MRVGRNTPRFAAALALLIGCGGAQQAPAASSPTVAEVKGGGPDPGPCAPGEGCADAPAGGEKVAQCNALIEVINEGVNALEGVQRDSSDPSGVRDLRAMADAMDDAATSAARVPVTSPRLITLSGQYQAMARDVAKAARDMAAAAKVKDRAGVDTAQEALMKAVSQEDPLVDAINVFCQEP